MPGDRILVIINGGVGLRRLLLRFLLIVSIKAAPTVSTVGLSHYWTVPALTFPKDLRILQVLINPGLLHGFSGQGG